MANIEVTLEQLINDSDWAQVFADENYGNVSKDTDCVPIGAAISTEPASRADVVEIIAAVNGENDCSDWIGVFRLRDGRFLVASGGCDYTGWDCMAGNHMTVAATMEDVLQLGLTEAERLRLGL